MKKWIAWLLAAALLTTGGCGRGSKPSNSQPSSAASRPQSEAMSAPEAVSQQEGPESGLDVLDDLLGRQGQVYQIYTFDPSLMDLVRRYQPDYRDRQTTLSSNDLAAEPLGSSEPDGGADGEDSAVIGDVTVKWHLEEDPDRYQDLLDKALVDEDAGDDDKVDLFLISGEMAAKYCDADSDVALTLDQLGLKETDLKNQYSITRDLVRDQDGRQRAVSWQVPAGAFVYRRSIAKSVLGTDNPVQVQSRLSNWKSFEETAGKLADSGYQMLSGYTDAYYACLGSREKGWVDGEDRITVDPAMADWVSQTKIFADRGYCGDSDRVFSSKWQEGFGENGKVFGAFLTSSEIRDRLLPASLKTPLEKDGKTEAGNGSFGDWAVCQGPSAFYQGGVWLCGAAGSDNSVLTGEILKNLTCSRDNLSSLAEETGQLTNHGEAMQELALDDAGGWNFLGGQNQFRLFDTAARDLKADAATYYDSGINSAFQAAFLPYFEGKTDKGSALSSFYREVLNQYPDLLNG